MAWFCGLIIFIDDYFNALAVGTLMRPIIDKNRAPRAKLAYVPGSTAATVCIIVPVSSWGTFAIMIPITMPIAVKLAEANGFAGEALVNAALICTGSVLGGAVSGGHASPVSDTTILSSTGAGCPHLEHVATQLPYSPATALCAASGTLAGSFTMNLAVTFALFALAIIFCPKILKGQGLVVQS